MTSKIERITVKLPAGFDARKHTGRVLTKIAEKHGEGWEVDSIDPRGGTLTASRFAQVTEVSTTDSPDTMVLGLARGTRPSDGEKIAAKFEDAHPGYKLTKFDPYLGQATMTKLSNPVIRAREAIRVALGVKAWDVQVRQVRGGGFEVELPNSYVPSKHDDKLTEVAEEVIGRPGWFVTTDPAKLTAKITPADPPTFPTAIPYPFADRLMDPSKKEAWSIPFGVALGKEGKDGATVALDFDATPGLLTVGTAGSGKSVSLAAMITGALERGYELAIGDVPHKAVDFTWVKKFCRPGGFGCASPEATLTMLRMVYEEGQRRAKLLAEHDVQKMQELPASVRPRPILVVLDEVTGMFALEDVPKGIPKDHPLVQEALQKNLVIQMIKSTVAKIPAELRFVGIRIIVATQMAQANTGISVPLKTNLANRMLLGANPNDAARGHAFLDPRSAPVVPEHIKADRTASRGVGVAELEGEAPEVFKSYYASTADYAEHLSRLRVPTTNQPEPTPTQIAHHTPSLDDDGMDDGPPPSRLDSGGWGEQDGRDAPPPKLKGAAAAAHQLRVEAAQAAQGG